MVEVGGSSPLASTKENSTLLGCCFLWLYGKYEKVRSEVRASSRKAATLWRLRQNPLALGCCFLWLYGKYEKVRSEIRASSRKATTLWRLRQNPLALGVLFSLVIWEIRESPFGGSRE